MSNSLPCSSLYNLEEMNGLAKTLAKDLKSNQVIAIKGALGAGKNNLFKIFMPPSINYFSNLKPHVWIFKHL